MEKATMMRRHFVLTLCLELLLLATLLLAMGAARVMLHGRDHRPLAWGLELELRGQSAYSQEMQERIERNYIDQCLPCVEAGFAYPLPAVWLALPIVALPDPAQQFVWAMLGAGSVLLGLHLLNMSRLWMLFVPVFAGVYVQQVSELLIGLLLVGLWAYRERRWYVLAALLTLTLVVKPQTTLLLAGALTILMLRAGVWRPLALGLALLLGLTALLDPLWPVPWFAALARFQTNMASVSLLFWVPVAGLLLVLRQPWSALAVLQVGLFPVAWPYGFLPLLFAYVDMRLPSRAVLPVVLLSWGILLPIPGISYTLRWSLMILTPLLVWAVLRWWQERGETLVLWRRPNEA